MEKDLPPLIETRLSVQPAQYVYTSSSRPHAPHHPHMNTPVLPSGF